MYWCKETLHKGKVPVLNPMLRGCWLDETVFHMHF